MQSIITLKKDKGMGRQKPPKRKPKTTTFQQCITRYASIKCPEIKKYVHALLRAEYNYLILKGHVQSGKTGFMIAAATINMRMGRSTIIILKRNKVDMIQIKDRIDQYNNNLQIYLTRKNIRQRPYEVKYLDTTFNINDFISAMRSEPPRIIVALGNDTQIGRINQAMDTISKNKIPTKYNLFIDECDLMDTIGTKTSDALVPLKEKADLIMGVSATVMDNLMHEQVDNNSLIMMDKPYGYRGIGTFVHPEIKWESACPCNRDFDDPFEKDPNLELYLNNLSKKSPIHIPYFNQKVPIMALINIGKVINPQKRLFNQASKLYPNFVFIMFNVHGLTVRCRKLGSRPITINTVEGPVTSTCKNKTHVFKNAAPGYFYQYLKDNGGVNRFTHIITIAGHLASRGLAFTSADYGEYMIAYRNGDRSKLGWRQNHIYYVASKSTDQPELIQNIGRPCVVASDEDNVPIHIDGPPETLNAGIRAYILQEDLINQARTKLEEEEEYDTIDDILPHIPVFYRKVPPGHSMCKKAKLTITKTCDLDKDKGFNVSMYKFDNEEKGIVERMVEQEYTKIGGLTNDEYDRLTKKMFPMWSRNRSNIAEFLHDLEPNRLYSKTELSKLAKSHGINRISELMKYSRGKTGSKGYGKIMVKDNNGYRLRQCLVDDFVKYF